MDAFYRMALLEATDPKRLSERSEILRLHATGRHWPPLLPVVAAIAVAAVAVAVVATAPSVV